MNIVHKINDLVEDYIIKHKEVRTTKPYKAILSYQDFEKIWMETDRNNLPVLERTREGYFIKGMGVRLIRTEDFKEGEFEIV